ncbi:MAG: hypothetical protein FWG34_13040 [Oscillospiraceae bacterium]|nr:hypothetical protein [Oscillospiraceae bacterium]
MGKEKHEKIFEETYAKNYNRKKGLIVIAAILTILSAQLSINLKFQAAEFENGVIGTIEFGIPFQYITYHFYQWDDNFGEFAQKNIILRFWHIGIGESPKMLINPLNFTFYAFFYYLMLRLVMAIYSKLKTATSRP